MSYSFSGRIRYSEMDENRSLSLYSLINYFQDCSNFHAEVSGVGLDWTEANHRAWMLASWQIFVDEYPTMGDLVEVSTWAYGFRGFIGYRNYEMKNAAGRSIARANSEWVFMDTEKNSPTKVPKSQAEAYGIEESRKLTDDFGKRKIHIPENGKQMEPFRIQEYHLDTNHHVNNGQYIRFAEAYLPRGMKIGKLRAEYKKQVLLGDLLYPTVAETENGFVVVLAREGEDPCFIGELTERTE
ncbi:MAG TPA: acyl-[acyl-carrier-protein] thioesterase [Candidatus Scatomonas pullistercoris]|uniref:Acyl-[acyl-carrier-protein] thioesterase n=1 Tax=Candidatus Scatomonas pullistercoris TaxID=2840920 RepID=A0A9D1P4E6_9FIRM|nr:acyl-[acyl-carrier-protein] thioesterase [Candidatus Scatomonas pullistercoris]